MLDMRSGQMSHALLSFGGFLCLGEKLFALHCTAQMMAAWWGGVSQRHKAKDTASTPCFRRGNGTMPSGVPIRCGRRGPRMGPSWTHPGSWRVRPCHRWRKVSPTAAPEPGAQALA